MFVVPEILNTNSECSVGVMMFGNDESVLCAATAIWDGCRMRFALRNVKS